MTTLDATSPGDITTQNVFIIQTRPNGTNEMRIDMFGPTMKTTTTPPSTKEENNARRPTTRIDTSLEDGFDFPFTTIGPSDGDSRTSTSSTSYTIMSTTQTVSRTNSTPFPPIVEHHVMCQGEGKSDCPNNFHCVAGRCQAVSPNQMKPTTMIITKSCNTNDDCEAKQLCVSSRCLTSCTSLTSNTTTLNPVDCFQGTNAFNRQSYPIHFGFCTYMFIQLIL